MNWRDKPVTDKQKAWIEKHAPPLNVHFKEFPKTRGEASEVIRQMQDHLREIVSENAFSIY